MRELPSRRASVLVLRAVWSQPGAQHLPRAVNFQDHARSSACRISQLYENAGGHIGV